MEQSWRQCWRGWRRVVARSCMRAKIIHKEVDQQNVHKVGSISGIKHYDRVKKYTHCWWGVGLSRSWSTGGGCWCSSWCSWGRCRNGSCGCGNWSWGGGGCRGWDHCVLIARLFQRVRIHRGSGFCLESCDSRLSDLVLPRLFVCNENNSGSRDISQDGPISLHPRSPFFAMACNYRVLRKAIKRKW